MDFVADAYLEVVLVVLRICTFIENNKVQFHKNGSKVPQLLICVLMVRDGQNAQVAFFADSVTLDKVVMNH